MDVRATDCNQPRPLRVVAIGDSLTAGTQDFTTVENRQLESYMPQLSKAVGFPFKMPTISEGGIGPRTFVNGEFNYGHAQQRGENVGRAVVPIERQLAAGQLPTEQDLANVWNIPNMGSRTPDTLDKPFDRQGNYSVPGYEIRHVAGIAHYNDYLVAMRDGVEATGVGGEVPLVRALLQNGTEESRGSALDQAIHRHPDLAVVWAGSNDALETVGHGRVDDRLLTPVEDRPWTYLARNDQGQWEQRTTSFEVQGFRSSLLGASGIIPRLLEETQSEIMLMTIPDVTIIPILRPLGEKVGDLPYRVTLPDGRDVTPMIENWTLPTALRGGAGKDGRTEFPAGSKVSMGNVLARFVQQGSIETPEQLQSVLDDFSQRGIFDEDDVLDADELDTISARIRDYNQVVHEAGSLSERVHVLDIHEEFNRLHAEGRELRGAGQPATIGSHFTGAIDAQGREGLFSYDGVHPSDTGHAVLANMLLDKIKEELGDRPKFAQFVASAGIDEKAVLARDPHHTGNAVVLKKAS
jgi:lysophospholipase L1-like esterase